MENTSKQTRFKALYKISAYAAILSEVVIIASVVAYFFYPYAPGNQSVEAVFQLLQQNPFGGLLSLDLLLVAGNLLGIILFLALYTSLKTVNPSYALIALVVGLLADILIIPARPLLEMLSISGLYSTATTAALKNHYLAAGQVLLVQFNGTAWAINTFFGGLSLLISALLMRNSTLYSKSTAWVGIATNLAVCLFFVPVIGMLFLFLSIPGYLLWYFQLSRHFFQLAKNKN